MSRHIHSPVPRISQATRVCSEIQCMCSLLNMAFFLKQIMLRADSAHPLGVKANTHLSCMNNGRIIHVNPTTPNRRKKEDVFHLRENRLIDLGPFCHISVGRRDPPGAERALPGTIRKTDL